MAGDQNKHQLYTESVTQSADILRLVIPQISKHKLIANPINYAVWYEYYLASNLQLKQAIDKNIENGTAITNELLESFFETHITDQATTVLARVQDNVLKLINNLSETTETTDSSASNYQQSLKHYGDLLESSKANQELPNILTKLVTDTQSMQSSMQTMRNHMNESQQEIQDLRNKLNQVTAEALSDALTGLANRKGLSKEFKKVLAQAQETPFSISLLMVDIDLFKKVNDTHGHLIGDKVIKFVADTLTMQLKGQDTASRFGGEEYVILLPNTPLRGAQAIAEAIRNKIEKATIRRANTQESIGQVTVSIGVANHQQNESLDSLIDRADAALYLSKQNGRNRVTVDQGQS